MHISEGVLSGFVCLAGYGAAAAVAYISLRKVKEEDIPKISVVTAVLFIGSFIYIPVGPATVHLLLNIFAGILLGWGAFPSILITLFFHAVMFGHGGISPLGVNAIVLGLPPLIAYPAFRWVEKRKKKWMVLVGVFFIGFLGTLASYLIAAGVLLLTDEAFLTTVQMLLAFNLVSMVVEGGICAVTVGYLMKVKPKILEG